MLAMCGQYPKATYINRCSVTGSALEGFETFSKKKAVFFQSGVNGIGLFKPPYGKLFERMVRLLLR